MAGGPLVTPHSEEPVEALGEELTYKLFYLFQNSNVI